MEGMQRCLGGYLEVLWRECRGTVEGMQSYYGGNVELLLRECRITVEGIQSYYAGTRQCLEKLQRGLFQRWSLTARWQSATLALLHLAPASTLRDTEELLWTLEVEVTAVEGSGLGYTVKMWSTRTTSYSLVLCQKLKYGVENRWKSTEELHQRNTSFT